MNYTYMVRCRDGSLYMLLCGGGTLYTGWTNCLEKRLACHNAGKGAKYTKSRLPVELVYYETFEKKEEAMRREWQIKQMNRKEKMNLIQSFPKEIHEKSYDKHER